MYVYAHIFLTNVMSLYVDRSANRSADTRRKSCSQVTLAIDPKRQKKNTPVNVKGNNILCRPNTEFCISVFLSIKMCFIKYVCGLHYSVCVEVQTYFFSLFCSMYVWVFVFFSPRIHEFQMNAGGHPPGALEFVCNSTALRIFTHTDIQDSQHSLIT